MCTFHGHKEEYARYMEAKTWGLSLSDDEVLEIYSIIGSGRCKSLEDKRTALISAKENALHFKTPLPKADDSFELLCSTYRTK